MYDPDQYNNKYVDYWKNYPPYKFTKYSIPTLQPSVGISVTKENPVMVQYNGQTKTHSLYECILNIGIGFVVAMVAQLVIFPLYNIHIPFSHNLQIGGWMTLVSLIRSYCLRRWFNGLTIPKKEI